MASQKFVVSISNKVRYAKHSDVEGRLQFQNVDPAPQFVRRRFGRLRAGPPLAKRRAPDRAILMAGEGGRRIKFARLP
jgi:hypothetical protein